ncbi:hypothetical protein D0Y65_037934, partial [Glycine soja]
KKPKWRSIRRSKTCALTLMALFSLSSSSSCTQPEVRNLEAPQARTESKLQNPLEFMRSKLVLMVSHELSLSLSPVVDARGEKAMDMARNADLVILNTAVAGKWLDAVLKEKVSEVLPKVLWWIHEMRGHYLKVEYIKHLPLLQVDVLTLLFSVVNVTKCVCLVQCCRIKMPETYAVHLGNSRELMEVAEDIVAKRVLREHVWQSLGVRNDDLLFGIINSVSRGKGQDLFLRSFYESLLLIQEKKLQVPSLHAIVVGSDMNTQTKFETELRQFVMEKKIQDHVHFVNKTLVVAPYLASIDVLVQNCQVLPGFFSSYYAWGECFGRITIEAMAFRLPVLAEAAAAAALTRSKRHFYDEDNDYVEQEASVIQEVRRCDGDGD